MSSIPGSGILQHQYWGHSWGPNSKPKTHQVAEKLNCHKVNSPGSMGPWLFTKHSINLGVWVFYSQKIRGRGRWEGARQDEHVHSNDNWQQGKKNKQDKNGKEIYKCLIIRNLNYKQHWSKNYSSSTTLK